MSPRLRKAIAGLFVVVFLSVWIWGAIRIVGYLPDNKLLSGLFLLVVGLGWGVPLFPVITWAEHGVFFKRLKP